MLPQSGLGCTDKAQPRSLDNPAPAVRLRTASGLIPKRSTYQALIDTATIDRDGSRAKRFTRSVLFRVVGLGTSGKRRRWECSKEPTRGHKMGIKPSLLTPVHVTDSCRLAPWHRGIATSRHQGITGRHGAWRRHPFRPAMPLCPPGDRFFRTYPCHAQETTYTENRYVFSLTGRILSFYMFSSLSSAGFSGT